MFIFVGNRTIDLVPQTHSTPCHSGTTANAAMFGLEKRDLHHSLQKCHSWKNGVTSGLKLLPSCEQILYLLQSAQIIKDHCIRQPSQPAVYLGTYIKTLLWSSLPILSSLHCDKKETRHDCICTEHHHKGCLLTSPMGVCTRKSGFLESCRFTEFTGNSGNSSQMVPLFQKKPKIRQVEFLGLQQYPLRKFALDQELSARPCASLPRKPTHGRLFNAQEGKGAKTK